MRSRVVILLWYAISLNRWGTHMTLVSCYLSGNYSLTHAKLRDQRVNRGSRELAN